MKPVISPFVIAVDCQEKQPYTFQGLVADANRDHRPLQVPTVWKSLGASRGDYSIEGLESQVGIERKSLEDAHGTFLGWGERRERFLAELETLASLKHAAVVVEATLDDLVKNAPEHGTKTAKENAKILFRQLLAWQMDFRIPWVFCGDRRTAEIATYRILERVWRKTREEERAAKRALQRQMDLI